MILIPTIASNFQVIMEYLHTPRVRRFSDIDMNAVTYNDLPVSFINWHKSIL